MIFTNIFTLSKSKAFLIKNNPVISISSKAFKDNKVIKKIFAPNLEEIDIQAFKNSLIEEFEITREATSKKNILISKSICLLSELKIDFNFIELSGWEIYNSTFPFSNAIIDSEAYNLILNNNLISKYD